MGFLGLISASKLAAEYDPGTQLLKLFAEGTIQDATYGIRFNREPWAGGLKFALEGWVGPLTGGTSPYVQEQSFPIHLPNKAYPSNNVIIVDLNNPKGVAVPIHWVSGSPPKAPNTPETPPDHDAPEESALAIPEDISISVLYKEPFTIHQSAELPKFGTIDIKFDESFLVLQTAGINDGNITWTFNAPQTGKTQIVVTIRGGIAQYVRQVIYDVNVHFPWGPGPVIIPTKNDSKLPVIPSFLTRVKTAREIVEAKYPEIALYNVHANTINPGGVTDPYFLTHMTVIFRDLKGKGTIIISSPGFEIWGPITYEENGILGNADIPWPVEIDALQADHLLREKGYKEPYTDLTLLKPLGREEAFYKFRLVTGREVWIGAIYSNVSFDGPDGKTK